jgi:hypothetical protein
MRFRSNAIYNLRLERRAIGGEVDYVGDLIQRTKAESSRLKIDKFFGSSGTTLGVTFRIGLYQDIVDERDDGDLLKQYVNKWEFSQTLHNLEWSSQTGLMDAFVFRPFIQMYSR